jgi:3-methyladenine DNA glycosylase AlkD
MTTVNEIKKGVRKYSNPKRAKINQKFFKTGKGQYGEGDVFLGLTMSEQRKIASTNTELPYTEIKKLLDSKYHEERMIGLLVLVYKFEKKNKDPKQNDLNQKKIFDFYLKNRKAINNWDLVDVTTPNIVGEYSLNKPKKDRSFLYKYAKSKNMWERRIAILATWRFIKHGQIADTLNISKILLSDKEDLIHKATGWMLREVGKVDEKALRKFLDANIEKMPRTALRYAIEKFPEKERKKYLAK